MVKLATKGCVNVELPASVVMTVTVQGVRPSAGAPGQVSKYSCKHHSG